MIFNQERATNAGNKVPIWQRGLANAFAATKVHSLHTQAQNLFLPFRQTINSGF